MALSNFLNKKRTVEIQPAPEIEASNDKYLEEFSSSIQQSLSAQKKSKSKNDSEHELTADDESKEEVGLDVRKDSIANFASSSTTSRSHGAETEDGEGSGVEDKGSLQLTRHRHKPMGPPGNAEIPFTRLVLSLSHTPRGYRQRTGRSKCEHL